MKKCLFFIFDKDEIESIKKLLFSKPFVNIWLNKLDNLLYIKENLSSLLNLLVKALKVETEPEDLNIYIQFFYEKMDIVVLGTVIIIYYIICEYNFF